ncbi:serine/threonine-protein kinase [Sinosporangium album]|uniref:serine/threonine-protein kinase n=1 Tax=Sinosporangium album TaxID=504805 RepID=UPI0015A0C1EB|nr:serine/threonine-protein kinase [Sinosporangium album]
MGGYVLASRVGEGGQGVVYEAYDEAGRRVALKVLHPEVASRVKREVTAAGRVASFCTARLIAADVAGERPFIVSEYVDGPSLARAVEEGGVFSGDRLIRLATAMATALTAIHEAGVVHRDLKPDNVLLGPDGPRVIDFGIARTKEMSLTLPAQVAGTPAYLSPEALTDAEVGQPADVFAWGAVVVFAATGSSPFDASSVGAVLHKVLAVEPDVSVLPEPLAALAAAALAKDAARRPTAAQVLFGLLSGGGAGGKAEPGHLLREGAAAAAALPLPELSGARTPELGEVAESVYAGLAPAEQAVVPDVMLRMVAPGDAGADGIRRTGIAELSTADPMSISGVVDAFTRAGLLVHEEDGVRPTGVALLRAWPRLAEWVEAERDGLPIHRRLTEAAGLWDEHGRKLGDLYQGTALEQATEWAATGRRHVNLNALETRFLSAGASAVRGRARKRRLVTAVLAGLLVVAMAAGGLVEVQRRESAAQRDLAVARSLALRAETMRDDAPVVAMRLSAAAWAIAPDASQPEIRGALYGSLAQPVASVFTAPGTPAAVQALSTDGTAMVGVADGTARVWDVASGRERAVLRDVGSDVMAAALSPKGAVLALHHTTGVRLWDVVEGRPMGKRFGPGANPVYFEPIEFDASGRYLILSEQRQSGPVWRVSDRRELVAPGGLTTMAVSPDGRLALASSGDATRWWDTTTGAAVPGSLPKLLSSQAVFSGDGRVYAVLEEYDEQRDDTVRLWDMSKRTELEEISVEPGSNIALSHDGTLLALASATEITVMRTSDGMEVLRQPVDADDIARPRFSDDGRLVHVSRLGGSVVSLRIPRAAAMLSPRGTPGSVAMAAGGGAVALEYKGTVSTFLTAAGRPAGPAVRVTRMANGVNAMALSPDGRVLAVGGFRTRGRPEVVLIDTAAGRVTGAFPLLKRDMEGVAGMAFASDGVTLAVSEMMVGDGAAPTTVELWNTRTRQGRSVKDAGGSELAFSPDGSRLLTPLDPHAVMVDTRSARVMPWPGGHAPLTRGMGPLAFRGDGKVVVLPDRKTVDLWDTASWKPQGRRVTRPGDHEVESAVFLDDGRTLAVAMGNKAQLWDVDTGRTLATIPLPEQDNTIAADAGALHVLSAGGALTSHIVDPARAARAVCERAGGGFSEADWQRHVPEAPYRDICADARDAT